MPAGQSAPALDGKPTDAIPTLGVDTGGLVEALDDALRLSSAMTLKAAAAGLNLGGGKAVILDDGRDDLRDLRLVALADELNKLAGRYVTAEDIGTNARDMDLIARHSPYVVGRSAPDAIGVAGGDPSPATARTVLSGIRSALTVLDGSDDLTGRTVGVVGLGKVGAVLARRLHEAGAEVIAFDPAKNSSRGTQFTCVESLESLLARPLDVLAPCAVGGMIDRDLAARLRCRVICGAANNPLTDAVTARVLAGRKVLYVPDFLANCGGLIQADAERRRATTTEVDRRMSEAETRTFEVLIEARKTGLEPQRIAEEHAQRRIASAQPAEGA